MACFFPPLNTILLLASCVKIVRTYRVGGRKLEAPGYMRAGITSSEIFYPGSGMALPGRDGRLGTRAYPNRIPGTKIDVDTWSRSIYP